MAERGRGQRFNRFSGLIMQDTTPNITGVEFISLLVAGLCFIAAFVWQAVELRRAVRASDAAGLARTSKVSVAWVIGGAVVCGAILIWRGWRFGLWSLPLSDYFDAGLLLAILLTGLWIWFRWTRQLNTLAIFLLPLTGLLILVGGILGAVGYRNFDTANPWIALHIGSILAGTVCFAAGCVSGLAYLLADRQLRHKKENLPLPPLARLEAFNRHAILLGFPLLTIAAITGIMEALVHPRAMGPDWYWSPKVILTVVAWAVYAPLLHVKLTPSFRGARAAWLSIFGFALLLTVFALAGFG